MRCVFQTAELRMMSSSTQMRRPDLAVTVPVTLNGCVFIVRGAVSPLSVVLCPSGRRLRVPRSELSEGKRGVNLVDVLAEVVPQLPFKAAWRAKPALSKITRNVRNK